MSITQLGPMQTECPGDSLATLSSMLGRVCLLVMDCKQPCLRGCAVLLHRQDVSSAKGIKLCH